MEGEIVVIEDVTVDTSNTSVTIDVKAIGDLYDELMKKAEATVNAYIVKNSIRAPEAAQIIAATIGNVLSVSAKIVQDAPIQAMQRKLIEKQADTEEKKALLTVRQTTAYDDNLRIKEGELLSNIMGMFGAGGTTLPANLETTTFDAINKITPQ
jgi:cytochrome P450